MACDWQCHGGTHAIASRSRAPARRLPSGRNECVATRGSGMRHTSTRARSDEHLPHQKTEPACTLHRNSCAHASARARGQPSPGRTHARALGLSLCTPGATKISHIASQRQSTHAAPLSSTSDTRRSRVVVKVRLECSAQARTIRGTERGSAVDVADRSIPTTSAASNKKKRGQINPFFVPRLTPLPTPQK